MNILVIGKGGREHALADAISRSCLTDQLYCAPGNPGMDQIAVCADISDSDVAGIVEFARTHKIDLAVIGPEASLALGMADALKQAGIPVFGPDKAAAQVESSKEFAKNIMARHDIPTARYETFTSLPAALDYVRAQGAPIVIKEDGLKAGKGVTVAQSLAEAENALQEAFKTENKVVIEECLTGFEYSLIALVHDDLVVPLEAAQDHKAVYDGDLGPNTGGMGAYSPVKKITPEIVRQTMDQIMIPMARAMKEEGVPFTGFLYGGLMLTEDGIKVIEFNARFGDPEAEVILPRLESDFVQAMLDVMNGQKPVMKWSPKTAHGVVLASTGYPASSTKGAPITWTEPTDARIFHMGTRQTGQDVLLTDGGRVLMAVTLEDTLPEAFAHTYQEVKKIESPALFYRSDIGRKDME